MADNQIGMVVVDGIRYRPEDAPKRSAKADEPEKARQAPNKARKAAANKSQTPED